MTNLSVNVNKIALLRNSRLGNNPSPIEFARKCLEGGAQGITVHPRPDLRHIRPDDLPGLAKLTSQFQTELNIEGNPLENKNNNYPGFNNLVLLNNPDQVTLVPDHSEQLTSDHGWDLTKLKSVVMENFEIFREKNIRTSIFLDPDIQQLEIAKSMSIDRVELYTGPFAEAFKSADNKELKKYQEAILFANDIDLSLNAGHDLSLTNLSCLLDYGKIEEVSIGHAFVVESLEFGVSETVNKYLKILQ